METRYLKVASIISFITAFIHLIGGQIDLIIPLIDSNLTTQVKGEFLAVWHMITVLLFGSAFLLTKAGFSKKSNLSPQFLKSIGWSYILTGIPFIVSSIYFKILAPQWTLLVTIGILTIISTRKAKKP